MPHEGLGGGDFLAALEEGGAPSEDFACGGEVGADDLDPGDVVALHRGDGDFLGFYGGAGGGLAVFEAEGDGLGAVVGVPEEGVVVALAGVAVGGGDRTVEEVLLLEGDAGVDCRDAGRGVEAVDFDFGESLGRGGAGGKRRRSKHGQEPEEGSESHARK